MPAIFTSWAALTHRAIDRRIILSENSPPGAYLGSSIAIAAIGMEKSREERIKLPRRGTPPPRSGVVAESARLRLRRNG